MDFPSNDPLIMEEGAQKQFDSQESHNEVDSPSNDPTIMEQKQFDPEELDNKE